MGGDTDDDAADAAQQQQQHKNTTDTPASEPVPDAALVANLAALLSISTAPAATTTPSSSTQPQATSQAPSQQPQPQPHQQGSACAPSSVGRETVFGQPTSTYYAMLTQYDPSISCGKSACTYIAGLATLAFLNHRDALVHDWESLIRRAASVIMMGQLSNSGTHSNLEDAMSTLVTAPECAQDEFLLPLVRGLDEPKFGVLLRSSKPRELPPRGVNRAPMLRELTDMFGDDFLVDVLADVLERCGDNLEETLNYLLENRDRVLSEQIAREDDLRQMATIGRSRYGGMGRAGHIGNFGSLAGMGDYYVPYERPSIEQQLREFEQNQERRYNHLAMRIAQERELLLAESAMYEVVEGKRGLGRWATRLLAPYLGAQRVGVVFTAQMQTMCLLVERDGTVMFRDSHRNEQHDFASVDSFFAWLEDSDLFTPMNDTDAEGFLDFGMVHFNKVDVYLVMIEH